MSKLTKLYLIKKNNLEAWVRETIKKISKKKLIFGSFFLKFTTVFKILQEVDHFTQKQWLQAIFGE